MYTSHRKASVFRGYVEHKLLNAMEKLTKSLPLFKERGCTVSLALDIRTIGGSQVSIPYLFVLH